MNFENAYTDVRFYISFVLALLLHDPKTRPWWNKIRDNIYLGALPHHDRSHLQRLKEDGIDSVITINEPRELIPSLIGTPVTPTDWMEKGIAHLHIPIPDMTAPSIEDIIRCISFIDGHNKVYIHCKAGKGRSAVVTICYLMYSENLTVDEAFTVVKNKRSIIHLNSEQLGRCHDFYECQNNVFTIE